jgi:hypothetical protein
MGEGTNCAKPNTTRAQVLVMGYRPSGKSTKASRRSGHEKYVKPLHEKGARAKQRHRHGTYAEETQTANPNAVWENTITRLHVLGNQRFGCSPFSEHFNRWLMNLQDVLTEFQANPDVKVDAEFQVESTRIVSDVERDLEDWRRKETEAAERVKVLADGKTSLGQIKEEYFAKARALRGQKSSEIKRLNGVISQLRQDLDAVVRVKAGLFRSISKKEREQKEMLIAQELSNRQTELELAMMDFTARQVKLEDEYETKRAPVAKQVKEAQKKIEATETDGSLEDRWFSCEALVDAVNALMQRKKLQPPNESNSEDTLKKPDEDT